ncbi:MAG TPA: FAD-dependent oxidoreductase [Planctomycetota bacterium]|nr:FAD-dependent oxidoreductase [Planctomycetota bacterium]
MNARARIAIAGGGPSGLMIGRLLAQDGHEVEILEAGDGIGGLCRSRTVEGHAFDLAGGHIMYTRDRRVADFWTELFADDPCVVTERRAAILHARDHWVAYPFENALGELPLEHNLECTEGEIRAHLRRAHEPPPRDFDAWIEWKMGPGIARHFMRPYNRKIWKADLAQVSTEWIADRVPDAPLADILRASLGETTAGYVHQSTFRYPRHGGFAAIHERIAAPIADRIRLHRRVERIERARDGGWLVDGVRCDHVVSTVPLHALPALMPDLPADVAGAARALRYRGVAGYLFGVALRDVRPLSWVYLPHPWQGPANRITYLSNYSPDNAPSGRGSILAEVTYVPGDEPDVSPAGQRALARALADAGILHLEDVTVMDAALNPVSYILYDLDFEAKRNAVLSHLDALDGFHALGRFGRYEYHNSDQCLAQALDLHARLAPLLARGGGPAAGPASRPGGPP